MKSNDVKQFFLHLHLFSFGQVFSLIDVAVQLTQALFDVWHKSCHQYTKSNDQNQNRHENLARKWYGCGLNKCTQSVSEWCFPFEWEPCKLKNIDLLSKTYRTKFWSIWLHILPTLLDKFDEKTHLNRLMKCTSQEKTQSEVEQPTELRCSLIKYANSSTLFQCGHWFHHKFYRYHCVVSLFK